MHEYVLTAEKQPLNKTQSNGEVVLKKPVIVEFSPSRRLQHLHTKRQRKRKRLFFFLGSCAARGGAFLLCAWTAWGVFLYLTER